MFNYNNLNVTLRVSPEISSANFYTKEESDTRYIKDVPEYTEGNVYGRTHGNWVKIDAQADFIYAGFSDATTAQAILSPENLNKLSKYYFSFSSVSGEQWDREASGIQIEEKCDTAGKVFWIYYPAGNCSITLTTPDGIPVQTSQHDVSLYSISGLAEGTYRFVATVRAG